MVEEDEVEASRHVVVRSHRCLHPFFTPTHLVLDPKSDGRSDERSAVWQSRRSRKARYAPIHHMVSSQNGSGSMSRSHNADETATELEKIMVDFRVQTRTMVKPHLILDVTFWLAVTFTLGSAIWVVNGRLRMHSRAQF